MKPEQLTQWAAIGIATAKRTALAPHMSKFKPDVRSVVEEVLVARLDIDDEGKVTDVGATVDAYLKSHPAVADTAERERVTSRPLERAEDTMSRQLAADFAAISGTGK